MAKVILSADFPSRIEADAIAILTYKNQNFSATGDRIDRQFKHKVSQNVRAEAFVVKTGNVLVYYTGTNRIPRVFVVAAPQQDSSWNELREAAYASVRMAQQHGLRSIVIAFDPRDAQELQAIGEGALLATYQYKPFQTKKDSRPKLERIIVCSFEMRNKDALRKASVFASAGMFVRDLVNEPPNILNATRIATLAKQIADKHKLQLKIYGAGELEKMGAHAFLSVGKGSPVESKMIHISYKPQKSRAHVALVGKGITFDSGGLSLKSEAGMQHMKSDMSGAATVLACVRAASELKIPVQVTGVLMATENMPDGGANRPGDVVRAMNGKTIEITNTDAEGRLALADGLTFAQSFSPDYLLDIATLTGAQVIGLGRLAAAVMSNNKKFSEMIIEAGEKSGEMMWPLPLIERYRDLIRSDTADMKNSSGIAEGPSIQAALFLSEFVDHPRWAHLDIAGPAWQEREWGVYSRNASGFSARCLLTLLSDIES